MQLQGQKTGIHTQFQRYYQTALKKTLQHFTPTPPPSNAWEGLLLQTRTVTGSCFSNFVGLGGTTWYLIVLMHTSVVIRDVKHLATSLLTAFNLDILYPILIATESPNELLFMWVIPVNIYLIGNESWETLLIHLGEPSHHLRIHSLSRASQFTFFLSLGSPVWDRPGVPQQLPPD